MRRSRPMHICEGFSKKEALRDLKDVYGAYGDPSSELCRGSFGQTPKFITSAVLLTEWCFAVFVFDRGTETSRLELKHPIMILVNLAIGLRSSFWVLGGIMTQDPVLVFGKLT